MPKLRYCSLCKRNVEAKKGFNWLVFIFLLGIPYLLFWALLKSYKCPVCGGRSHLSPAQ